MADGTLHMYVHFDPGEARAAILGALQTSGTTIGLPFSELDELTSHIFQALKPAMRVTRGEAPA